MNNHQASYLVSICLIFVFCTSRSKWNGRVQQTVYWPGKNNCLQNYQTNMSNIYTDCTKPGQRTNWNFWNPWIIVCIALSNPLKTPPPLSCQATPPLDLQIAQAFPFLGNPLLYIGFSWTPPPSKIQIFPWTPKILKFFILHLILFFKSNLSLVKISQFEFLVMTEQRILVYELFCHKIFQILVYFLLKNCNIS